MNIDISKVAKITGASIEVNIKKEHFEVNSLKWGVEFTKPVEFNGKLENIDDLLLLTGVIKTTYKTNCDRCTKDLEVPLELKVREELVDTYDLQWDEDKSVDCFTFQRQQLNLEPIIRNYLSLNLPMSNLCSEDCKGICQSCGNNFNHGECDCDNDIDIDPRLEALKKLLDK